MTVASPQRRVSYVGDGVTTVFPVPFRFSAAADLQVIRAVGGVETVLGLNVDYTVAGSAVTFGAAPSASATIVILRQTARTQNTAYVPNDPFPAETHEAALDKLTMITQELGDDVGRAVLVPEADPARGSMVLPAQPDRASRLAAYDAFGRPAVGPDVGILLSLAQSAQPLPLPAMTRVATVSAVRALDVSALADGVAVAADAFGAVADFGGGVFIWSATATGADDGGTVLVPTGHAGPGRWLRQNSMLTPQMFGAAADDLTDDRPALVAMEAATGLLGGEMHLPVGEYRVSATGGRCWQLGSPVRLSGEGFYTAVRASGVSASDDCIYISPDGPPVDNSLSVLSSFSIGNLSNGTREGRHGIHARTEAGDLLPKLIIREVAVQASSAPGSRGIVLSNHDSNVTGGIYCSSVQDSLVKGGISLDGTGDSNVLARNVVTGAGVGYDIATIGGASGPFLYDENCTSAGGTMVVRRGRRLAITNPNFELQDNGDATANGGAVIHFLNDSGIGVGGYISGGLVSGFTDAIFDTLVRVENHTGLTFRDVTFSAGHSGASAIAIEPTARNTRVYGCTLNVNVGDPDTAIDDRGVGTMGVVQHAAAESGALEYDAKGKARLRSGWQALTGEGVSYMKCPASGRVSIEGDVYSGVDGIVLRLPVGFRPWTDIERAVDTYDGTTWGKAIVMIHGAASADGGKVIVAGSQPARLCLSGMSFDAWMAAHADSYE